jgi:hypothetical protein
VRKRTTLPVSLRLSFEEKARLQQDAAGLSLSAYIRWRLFDPEKPPPRKRGKQPVKDHEKLAQVLGLLGQSRLSSNLNQLAKALNSGSLALTPGTEAALLQAASEVALMRNLLIEALNLEPVP